MQIIKSKNIFERIRHIIVSRIALFIRFFLNSELHFS
jgi:hypothetical protein